MLVHRLSLSFRRLIRDFSNDVRGAVAIMGAAFLVAAILFGALVADLGYAYWTKRTMQGVTDVAALVAARNIGAAQVAAANTINTNRMGPTDNLNVVLGRYEPDPDIAPSLRFTPGSTPANAVRVSVDTQSPLFLGRMFMGQESLTLNTTATAATSELAAFSIGSRLASLNGGIANALLGAVLGGNINLRVMDYNALVDAEVDLFRFVDALATRLDVEAGTYDSVLSADATVGVILSAAADALVASPNEATARAALGSLALAPRAASLLVPAAKLLDIGPYAGLSVGEPHGLDAHVSAYSLVNSAIMAANGDRQLNVNLSALVPSLAAVRAEILVGERPQGTSWIAVGQAGATVYTAQTRIRLAVEVAGLGLLGGHLLKVPLLIDVAHARASLASTSCGENPVTDGLVELDVRPGVLTAWIGEPNPETGWTDTSRQPNIRQVELVRVPLLASIKARAAIDASNVTDTRLAFTWEDFGSSEPKTVSTRTPVQSLGSSLLNNVDLSISALGGLIPIDLGVLTRLVGTILSPVGPLLDPVIVGLLEVLGVRVGEADVWVQGLRCDGAVLVN